MKVYIAVELQRQVRERFANCCAYCRTAEVLSVATFDFEHIVPRSVGGATAFDNLCFSCPTCNRYKSDLVSAPDPVTLKEVALFHPQQDRWLEHFAWNEDATQIVGLTPTGRATIVALKMNRQPMIRLRQMWVAMKEHPPGLD
jgi:hypothetical protein